MRHFHSLPPYDEVTRADLDRDAREYADTTIRHADRTPSKPDHRPTRPAGKQWGDDIPDPFYDPQRPTEAEYVARVDQHKETNR